MAGIIHYQMFLNALQLACNLLLLLVHGGLAIFRFSSTHENWNHYHLLTHYPSRVINPCNGKK